MPLKYSDHFAIASLSFTHFQMASQTGQGHPMAADFSHSSVPAAVLPWLATATLRILALNFATSLTLDGLGSLLTLAANLEVGHWRPELARSFAPR